MDQLSVGYEDVKTCKPYPGRKTDAKLANRKGCLAENRRFKHDKCRLVWWERMANLVAMIIFQTLFDSANWIDA
jgi:hypothetical protein